MFLTTRWPHCIQASKNFSQILPGNLEVVDVKLKPLRKPTPSVSASSYSSHVNVDSVAMWQRPGHEKCLIPAAVLHPDHW